MNPHLAVSLARPVARGWLSLTQARAMLLADAAGDLGRYRVHSHALGLRLEQERLALAIDAMRARWAEKRHGR